MSTIDAHVHLYPPGANADPAGWAVAQGEPHWATLCTRRRQAGQAVQAFPSVDELLRAMDAAGVARAVLLGWYWNRPETCVIQNRYYADCVRRHPDRLAAFATLHPAAGRAATLAEVRRAHEEGLIGVGELSPHSQGYAIDDPVFRAVLAFAGERELPVNLHVTDPDSREYPGKVATPFADFVRLARECPSTNFVLAHWGGLLPLREIGAMTLSNVYYDTAASPLLYDAGVWGRFIAAVGANRVLFGSDYPLNLYPWLDPEPGIARFVAEARNAGLDHAQLTAVMGGNAERLM
ncbi:MAG: amidohydrolase [Opitutaceae bacterium]|nr:amidohydrolase [Opitutaceae bacterium]